MVRHDYRLVEVEVGLVLLKCKYYGPIEGMLFGYLRYWLVIVLVGSQTINGNMVRSISIRVVERKESAWEDEKGLLIGLWCHHVYLLTTLFARLTQSWLRGSS